MADTLLQHWKSAVSWSAAGYLFPRGQNMSPEFWFLQWALVFSWMLICLISGSCFMWPSDNFGQRRNSCLIQVNVQSPVGCIGIINSDGIINFSICKVQLRGSKSVNLIGKCCKAYCFVVVETIYFDNNNYLSCE